MYSNQPGFCNFFFLVTCEKTSKNKYFLTLFVLQMLSFPWHYFYTNTKTFLRLIVLQFAANSENCQQRQKRRQKHCFIKLLVLYFLNVKLPKYNKYVEYKKKQIILLFGLFHRNDLQCIYSVYYTDLRMGQITCQSLCISFVLA